MPELKEWLSDKPNGERVWNWKVDGAGLVRLDLRDAGIDYMDEFGEVVDFHALRHTAITRWSRTISNIKSVQNLARHAEPSMTMRYY